MTIALDAARLDGRTLMAKEESARAGLAAPKAWPEAAAHSRLIHTVM